MINQVRDSILFDGDIYQIIPDNLELFNPKEFGIYPKCSNSSIPRGFISEFSIVNSENGTLLYLDTVKVLGEIKENLLLFDIKPVFNNKSFTSDYYYLQQEMRYSGYIKAQNRDRKMIFEFKNGVLKAHFIIML